MTTNFDKWVYFLKNLEDFNAIPEILKDSVFLKAFEKAEIANYNDAQRMAYEESVKIYRDNVNVVKSSYLDGEKKVKNDVVIKSLKKNLDIKLIMELTELTEEEILKVKQDNNL